MSLGTIIASLRRNKGWTQAHLADLLQMNANHVSRWEKDRMRPRKKVIEKMAELFGVSSADMLAGESTAGPRLYQEDPELAELLAQVAALSKEQRSALRTVLRSMLACQAMDKVMESVRGAA